MEWTKSKPTVPGWYWIRYGKGKKARIILVIRNRYRELWVRNVLGMCINKVDEYNHNYCFYGPIDPPALPGE